MRCHKLNHIAISEDNAHYSNFNNDGVIYDKDITTIIFFPSAKKTEYQIPDTIITIGKLSFFECINSQDLIIPNNVLIIEANAFMSSSFKSITIGDNVKTIEAAFSYSVIENITISSSVTSISENAFKECNHLQYIKVSEQNPKYSNYENDGILYDKNVSYLIQYPQGNKNEIFNIPNSVDTIRNESFSGCNNIKIVTIPESVTLIQQNYFGSCKNLRIINISKSNPKYSNYENDGVVYDKNITKLIVYPLFKEISDLILPNTLINIGKSAFSKVKFLVNLTIPNSIKIIEELAFNECYNLTTLYIGENVEEIQSLAFSECFKLQCIYFYGKNKPTVAENAFDQVRAKIVMTSETYKSSKFGALDVAKGKLIDECNPNYGVEDNNKWKIVVGVCVPIGVIIVIGVILIARKKKMNRKNNLSSISNEYEKLN